MFIPRNVEHWMFCKVKKGFKRTLKRICGRKEIRTVWDQRGKKYLSTVIGFPLILRSICHSKAWTQTSVYVQQRSCNSPHPFSIVALLSLICCNTPNPWRKGHDVWTSDLVHQNTRVPHQVTSIWVSGSRLRSSDWVSPSNGIEVIRRGKRQVKAAIKSHYGAVWRAFLDSWRQQQEPSAVPCRPGGSSAAWMPS